MTGSRIVRALGQLERAGQAGKVSVLLIDSDPLLAVGRDDSGAPVIIFDPLAGAFAFRNSDVEFLPDVNLVFDDPAVDLGSSQALFKYDETALGGAYELIAPELIWALIEVRRQEGEDAAAQYAAALSKILYDAVSPVDENLVQGTWAEIAVILGSEDPVEVIRAWHEDPKEHYDFAAQGQRLEVKSTRGSRHQHVFSSSQLPPSKALNTYVVSVLVQRVAGGSSIKDLLVLLRGCVGEAAYQEALRKTLAVLPIGQLSRSSFDLAFSLDSRRYYDAQDLPFVTLPKHVLRAKWTIDLHGLPQRTEQAPGSLLSQAMPQGHRRSL